LLFGLIFLIIQPHAYAWDGRGHGIVAGIAEAYLDSSVSDSVKKYLGNNSFEEAAVWMDEIRRDPTYDYMKPWHYINIEKDKTYVASPEDNIVNQLERILGVLRDGKKRKKSEVRMNLKILFHLVGDIHQPLHTGYGADRGGNTVEVLILGSNTNLHHVWDTDILDAKKITLQDCLKLASALSPEKRKALAKTDVLTWMNESRSYLPAVYDFKDNTIDKDYINKNAPVVLYQLVRAGLRLAEVLNTSLGKQGAGSVH
jgi:hypothetical protein